MSSDEPTAVQDEQQTRLSLSRASELKAEGNQHHSAKDWEQAIATYRMALGQLPSRPIPPKAPSVEPPISDGEDASNTSIPSTTQVDKSSINSGELPDLGTQEAEDPLVLECAKARAVLNANVAACFIQLEKYNEAAEACTAALKDDPVYVKALQRRALSNDKIDSWSSLTQAQEDYNSLLGLLPTSAPERVGIQRSVRSIKPRLEQAQKRETAEMLDKLKGVGNSILGKFGLSTDNFKFEPSGGGGYSMKFSPNS